MKKQSKIAGGVILLLATCTITGVLYFSTDKLATVEEVREQFDGKILSHRDIEKFDTLRRYSNNGDSASAIDLIVSENYRNRFFFHKLLKQNLYLRFIGEPDSAAQYLQVASKIAQVYEDSLQDRFLKRELAYSESLTDERLRQKITAEMFYGKGQRYYNKAAYDSAKIFYDVSLRFSRKIDDQKLIADNLLRFQYFLFIDESLEKALEIGQEILAITDKIGYNFRNEWVNYNNATILYKLDNYKQALDHTEKALFFAELIGDEFYKKSILKVQGDAHFRLGETNKAMDCYHDVIDLVTKAGNLESLYRLHLEIAIVYASNGKYDQAQELLETALEKKDIIKNKQIIAAIIFNLGELFLIQGDHDKAHTHLDKALMLFDEIKENYDSATTTMLIGDVFFAENNLKQAEKFYNLALEKFNKTGNTVKPRRFKGEIYLSLGDIQKSNGLVDAAMDYYNRALKIFEVSELPKRSGLSLIRKGHIYREKGKLAKALQNFQLAKKIATNIGNIRLLWNSLYGIGMTYKSKQNYQYANNALAAAVTIIDTTRAHVSEDMRISYFATIQDIYDEMILLQLEHGKEEAAFYYSERSRARKLLDLFNSRSSSTNGYLTDFSPIDNLKDFQNSLDEKTKIIEYKITNEKIVFFIIGKDHFEVIEKNYSKDDMQQKVSEFRQAILFVKKTNEYDKAYANSLEKAKTLYNILIEPLSPFLKEDDKIVFSPDDALWYLPFSALVKSDNKQNVFLIEKYDIAYVPSVTVFSLGVADSNPPTPTRLFAIANPDGSLPASSNEVRQISKLFIVADTLYEDEISEKRVTGLINQNEYDVIHFATHGILNEKKPLNSYLFLGNDSAYQNNMYNSKNGVHDNDNSLKCNEIYNFSLPKVQLVTLSACESAGGRFYRGEGIVGMAHAFLHAGAESMLTSLWYIDDEYTQEIMTAFYENWLQNKSTKVHALTLAQRKLINKLKNDPVTKFPYLYAWAAFTLIGQN